MVEVHFFSSELSLCFLHPEIFRLIQPAKLDSLVWTANSEPHFVAPSSSKQNDSNEVSSEEFA